jgi:hypothetical protein
MMVTVILGIPSELFQPLDIYNYKMQGLHWKNVSHDSHYSLQLPLNQAASADTRRDVRF